MLFDLKVLNGVMTPKFDKYSNIYSVTIEENVTELLLEYKASPDNYVKVKGNSNLKPGDNIVYIDVITEDTTNTYRLFVYKEYTETVFKAKELLESVEVKKELPEYVAPLIGGTCLLIIILFGVLLFKKRKN